MSSMGCDDVNANRGISTDLVNAIVNGNASTASSWESASADEIVKKLQSIYSSLQPKPAAYIVTDNRGKHYLVFAGSVEHENAVMFKYDIKPLYE